MTADSEIGKRALEPEVLDPLLATFATITGRTMTKDWTGEARQVEGSPEHIIGLDGRPFGIDFAEIRNAKNAWEYVIEAHRLASQKSANHAERGIFKLPVVLMMYSTSPALYDLQDMLNTAAYQADFESLGFAEIWAIDFSDAHYSVRDPATTARLFCFKPVAQFGIHGIGEDRKALE